MGLFLVLVFFLGQAFSCCLVNVKLAHFLHETFASVHGQGIEEHACCKAHGNNAEKMQGLGNWSPQMTLCESPNSNSLQTKDCCIQDANARLPLMPSQAFEISFLADYVQAILPYHFSFENSLAQITMQDFYGSFPRTPLGEKLYLSNLQILI